MKTSWSEHPSDRDWRNQAGDGDGEPELCPHQKIGDCDECYLDFQESLRRERMFRSNEGVLYRKNRTGIPQIAADPANSFRCMKCEAVVLEEFISDQLLLLQVCSQPRCVSSRISDLNNEEACLSRIAEIVLKQPHLVDLQALEKELAKVRFWSVYREVAR